METNPAARQAEACLSPWQTAAQRDAEATAVRVLASDTVRQARAKASHLWRLAHGQDPSPQAWATFDDAMDEYAANYVLKAVASDADHPRFVCNFMTPRGPHEQGLFAARIGGDNPDNVYRLAGIAHGAHYRVHIQVRGVAPSSVSFTLVGNYGTSVTLQTIELHQLVADADGTFTLHIDADEPAGRTNHLRTAPHVKFLFVRDSLNDWAHESPLGLSIERLDAPTAPPIDDAEIARRAAFRMVEEVPLYYWFSRLCTGKPVNTSEVAPSGAVGGLVTQAGSSGWFRLADDEALVLRIDPAGAGYFSFVAYDWWWRSIDPAHRCSCRNAGQTTFDADGCATYVVSAVDPGVPNWIDTTGLREGLLIARWQSLPATAVRAGPQFRLVEKIALRDLARLLPPGTAHVDAAARQAELAARERHYQRRYQAVTQEEAR